MLDYIIDKKNKGVIPFVVSRQIGISEKTVKVIYDLHNTRCLGKLELQDVADIVEAYSRGYDVSEKLWGFKITFDAVRGVIAIYRASAWCPPKLRTDDKEIIEYIIYSKLCGDNNRKIMDGLPHYVNVEFVHCIWAAYAATYNIHRFNPNALTMIMRYVKQVQYEPEIHVVRREDTIRQLQEKQVKLSSTGKQERVQDKQGKRGKRGEPGEQTDPAKQVVPVKQAQVQDNKGKQTKPASLDKPALPVNSARAKYVNLCGHNLFTADMKKDIALAVTLEPYITADRLINELSLPVSRSDVTKFLRDSGLSGGKMSVDLIEASYSTDIDCLRAASYTC
jgi:hypothetical protein